MELLGSCLEVLDMPECEKMVAGLTGFPKGRLRKQEAVVHFQKAKVTEKFNARIAELAGLFADALSDHNELFQMSKLEFDKISQVLINVCRALCCKVWIPIGV